MTERRPIAGFEGIYEVSADGELISLAREITTKGRKTRQLRAQKLSPSADAKGYLVINLHKGGTSHIRYVHRLVLEAFAGPCPEGCFSIHIDGDPANNALANLRWGQRTKSSSDPHEPPKLVSAEEMAEAPAEPPVHSKTKGWRKEPVKSPGGVSWRLVRGRADDRIRANLGRISEADAQKALEHMQAEEDAGTVGRVLALHEEDQELAVRYLVGDSGVALLLPKPPVDYSAMTLRRYQEEVYAPWRMVENKRGWRSEAGHWQRILSELGSLRLREVDAHAVADYLDGMLVERGPRKGLPAAGNTKRLRRAALQALLMRAERLRHIERAPDLGRFRIKGATQTVLQRSDPLSLEELTALMDASAPKHRAMWAVGAGEGLRPSELMRVRWEDVSWEQRTLAVRGDDEGQGKTALAVDVIPMTPLAYQELQAWWMRQGQPAAGLAFPGRKGEAYQAESAYKKALATAAKRAGLTRPVTPYLLRHSFATIAWSLGIDQDVARRVMRHVDLAMLDRVYCRPRPADLVAKMAAFVQPMKEGG